MSELLNFVEIQAGIEFLKVIIYFLFSVYMFFLLFLKRSITDKEKNILQALSFGFLAISVAFVFRLFVQHSMPGLIHHQSIISTVLFMMLLVLPVQYYCSNRINSIEYGLKSYAFALLILLAANIIALLQMVEFLRINAWIYNTCIYGLLSLYLIYSGYLIFRFNKRIFEFSREDWHALFEHKNDIFIFLSYAVFSIILLIFVYFDVRFLYIKGIFLIFTIINTLLFLKITIPYNSFDSEYDLSSHENQNNLQSERHKLNRQLSENIKADELYDRLLVYFDRDKPYLKPDLKIKEVALYLYSNKTYLSRIINDKNNQNFNQFVNYYRIEEVKKLFNTNTKLNIQELCCLSGFGSMATFSIAFRYYLGYTPADWCKEQKLRIQND